MLTTLETDLLKELASHRNDPCVSIYIPTHVKGREIEQDPIRLKNALSVAETELGQAGLDDSRVGMLLSRARQRIEDRDFWRHQGSGLAIFISNDLSRIEGRWGANAAGGRSCRPAQRLAESRSPAVRRQPPRGSRR